MMGRYRQLASTIGCFFILLFAALNTGCDGSNKVEEKKQAYQQKQQDRKNSAENLAREMAERTNAITGWKEKLGSTDFASINRVYTVDVERVWLNSRPILFIGVLEDVVTHDTDTYNLYIRDYSLFFPELRLHITCKRSLVDPVMKQVKSDKESIVAGGVVLSAKIENVTHEMEIEKEEIRHVFVGQGECIEIAHVGDAIEGYLYHL